MAAQDYVMSLVGNTTETLSSSPYGVLDYIPSVPSGEIDEDAVITESMRVRLKDTTYADNIAETNDIERLFEEARMAQIDPSITRVYLTMKNNSTDTEYRSEVLDGYVEWDDQTLARVQWENKTNIITIYITRRWYWEATTAVQMALDNNIESGNTTGLTIYNPSTKTSGTGIAFVAATSKITDTANGLAHFMTGDTIQVIGSTSNDGTYTVATGGVAGEIVTNEALVNEGAAASVTIIGENCNYVEIPAAQVATVVNAPIRLEMTNAVGGAVSYKDIYAGASHMADIANMVWFYEGESATNGGGIDSSTDTESAACSGGFYNELVWSDDTEKELCTWSLTAAVLAACRGSHLRALIRLQGGTIAATLQLKLSIKLSTTTVWSGPLITAKADDYKQDLGIIQLPPALFGQTAPKALTLALTGKQTGGGTINLDFLELFPIDTFRALRSLNYSVADGDDIFIDELNSPREVYGIDSGSKKYPIWIVRGDPLKVQHNTKQRIFIAFDEQDHDWDIGRKSTVKAYYRPRRLSL